MGYRVDDLTSFPIFLPVSIGSLGTSLTSLPAIPQTQSTLPPHLDGASPAGFTCFHISTSSLRSLLECLLICVASLTICLEHHSSLFKPSLCYFSSWHFSLLNLLLHVCWLRYDLCLPP